MKTKFNFIFGILLISVIGLIFSNLDIPDADAGKFSKMKSKNKSHSFKSDFDHKKSDFKPQKSDFKPQKSDFKPQKSDFKPQKSDFKNKKFKPDSFSQGSSLNLKPSNIKDLNKDGIKDLNKDAIKDLNKDADWHSDWDDLNIDDLNIDDIDIDDIDIDDIDIDDIDIDDIDIDDIDIDDDIHIEVDDDDDDDDVIYIDDDDDDDDEDSSNTYIYNYGNPQESLEESSAIYNKQDPLQQEGTSAQSYMTSEVKRIVNEGSFKAYTVETGKPLLPVNNSGYVLLGANQGVNELSISNGLNGQIIILTGYDDTRPIKISSTGNIDLNQTEATLGKNDSLILAFLDGSSSWVQVASKMV